MRRALWSLGVLVLVAVGLGMTFIPVNPRAGAMPSMNLINWKHPLNRGLVAWWLVLPKRTGGVLLRNMVAGRNHCTLTNMANSSSATSGWGLTTRRGGLGEMRFDLTNDYLDCTTQAATDFTGNMSVAVWINPTSDGGGGTAGRIIDRRGNTGAGGWLVTMDNHSGDAVSFGLNANSTYGVDYASTAGGTITLGVWQRVVVSVVSATSATFYVNGKVVTQDTGSGVLNQAITSSPTIPLQIGAASGRTDRNFEGKMDDIRLWNRALSAKEALDEYQLSLVRHSAELNDMQSSSFMMMLTRVRGLLY